MKSSILFVLAVIFLIIALWRGNDTFLILACCCLAVPGLPEKKQEDIKDEGNYQQKSD